jgi:hypothetical protein
MAGGTEGARREAGRQLSNIATRQAIRGPTRCASGVAAREIEKPARSSKTLLCKKMGLLARPLRRNPRDGAKQNFELGASFARSASISFKAPTIRRPIMIIKVFAHSDSMGH